jgi:hypothetical protein
MLIYNLRLLNVSSSAFLHALFGHKEKVGKGKYMHNTHTHTHKHRQTYFRYQIVYTS